MPPSPCLRRVRAVLIPLAATFAVTFAAPALAQADRCPKLVAEAPARVLPAAFRPSPQPLESALRQNLFRIAAGAPDEVTLNYIGHSTFLIETAGGVTVATDYNDYVRADVVPRVATMNRAHSTHFSLNPDPGIEHVLKGWGDTPGQPARYDLDVGDLWIGNLPTNTRDWEGGTVRNGNSIFVFRAADLCIAHLGHLHHTLTEDDIAALGRIDVVLAPVDGSYTLDVDGLIEVLKALESPLVIPMHYFNPSTLDAFLNRLGGRDFVIERQAGSSLVVSRASLPRKPTVVVLPPR
ncbi:MBL fold metallo-hydrolase [Ancylobacter sp. Lp-2]|uniref:MBL fold metallo-hydrolase n=1 Tax=Ancylobacter sp. Lp-2 TaxID=2881339 RepID=UPI001E2A068D|nr:MBL fold metallo-hydrolase [Ancylobacter sp. Lp-2]MCB4771145.1 MBL fold metallo-hydrolase [Ancylobacter sp. Lp-2]